MCRIVNQSAVIIEPGTVAWAVPGLFRRVPLQLTAQMGAPGRGFVQDSLFVLIAGIPFESNPYDAAMTLFQVRGTEGQVESALRKGDGTFTHIGQKAWEGCPDMESLGAEESCVWILKSADLVPYDYCGQHGRGHPPIF